MTQCIAIHWKLGICLSIKVTTIESNILLTCPYPRRTRIRAIPPPAVLWRWRPSPSEHGRRSMAGIWWILVIVSISLHWPAPVRFIPVIPRRPTHVHAWRWRMRTCCQWEVHSNALSVNLHSSAIIFGNSCVLCAFIVDEAEPTGTTRLRVIDQLHPNGTELGEYLVHLIFGRVHTETEYAKDFRWGGIDLERYKGSTVSDQCGNLNRSITLDMHPSFPAPLTRIVFLSSSPWMDLHLIDLRFYNNSSSCFVIIYPIGAVSLSVPLPLHGASRSVTVAAARGLRGRGPRINMRQMRLLI